MQILNISKLRNGIGILKKQENITENLTAEENRKEITETMENAAQRRNLHADRHERIQQPQRRKQTRQQGKKKKAERLKRKPEQRRKQKVRLQRL